MWVWLSLSAVNEIIEHIKNCIYVDIDNNLVYEYIWVADHIILYTYISYDIDILIGQSTHIFISRSTHALLIIYIISKHYYNNHWKDILNAYTTNNHTYVNIVITHALVYAYNLYIMNIQLDMVYVLLLQIYIFIVEMIIIILTVLGI